MQIFLRASSHEISAKCISNAAKGHPIYNRLLSNVFLKYCASADIIDLNSFARPSIYHQFIFAVRLNKILHFDIIACCQWFVVSTMSWCIHWTFRVLTSLEVFVVVVFKLVQLWKVSYIGRYAGDNPVLIRAIHHLDLHLCRKCALLFIEWHWCLSRNYQEHFGRDNVRMSQSVVVAH